MARRSTKAGPARSRRRPDPATLLNPSQPIGLLIESNASPGTGSLQYTVSIVATIQEDPPPNDFYSLTDEPSNAKFLDSLGNVHPMTAADVDTAGEVTYEITSGLPSGSGTVWMPGLDPAVRGKDGSWLGTFLGYVTIL